MTKQIEYAFEKNGVSDYVNYYRSENPMNIEAMPSPNETNILELTHIDSTAINDVKYFVRFSAVKGGVEKISDEVFVYQASEFVGTPFLVASTKNTAVDWSSSSSDYSAVINADAGWASTDYVIITCYSRSATVTTTSGLSLLFSSAHSTILNAYIHVFGGIKGSTTSFPFTFSTASGGSCFGMTAVALSDVDSLVDHVYTEKSGLYFNQNEIIGSTDGLIAVTCLGYDANISVTFSPTSSPASRFSFSNAVNIRGSGIYVNQIYDDLNISKSLQFSTNVSSNIPSVTMLFSRKSGTRDVITYNKTTLQSQIETSVGFAYAILKDGEIIESVVGGVEKSGGNLITESSVFQVASISKLVTEVAIRKLEQDGLLTLNDTIGSYFSGITLGTNVANIKIKDLLAMRAGIVASFDVLNADYIAETHNWLSNSASNIGSRYIYDNGCFAVLHLIINQLTGSYVDYIQNNIFKKIGIYDATHDSSTLTMMMHSSSGADAPPLNVYATAVGGWCMSLNSLSKLAKALRYSIILSDQNLMKQDRYRMSPINSARGEMFQHDGALVNGSNIGIRSQYMHGCDGYDVIALTNTYLTNNMISTCRTVLSS